MKKPSLLKSLALLRGRAISWGTEVERLSLRQKASLEELSVLLQEKPMQPKERSITTENNKNYMPEETTIDPVVETPVEVPVEEVVEEVPATE